MQEIVYEQPYEFIPPVKWQGWPWMIRFYLHRYLRKRFGVHTIECRHTERLQASIDAGHSVIVTPNHCRLADPLVLGELTYETNRFFFAMASWHLFMESGFARWMLRRMGAFSVYREGNDRQAIHAAIEILMENQRPLVIFPEGTVSRHNDILMELMDGPAFIARQAAKKLQKLDPPREIVIHPIAIRYSFDGDLAETLNPVLDEFEARFTWSPQRQLSLVGRIAKLGEALLSLKEIEYLGAARNGDPYERAEVLVDEVLTKLEAEWGVKDRPVGVVARAKKLRSVILPDMIAKKVTSEERQRRWRHLAACYYLQQIAHYPRNYIQGGGKDMPERVVETVERFEEDFTDKSHKHEPLHCTIDIGEAISVSPHRDRGASEDPLTAAIRDQLQGMLSALSEERAAAWAKACEDQCGAD